MTADEYREAALDVARLAACAVNGEIPDMSLVKSGTDRLYEAAERHLLTAAAAMALESAGIRDEKFTRAKGMAIRREADFAIARASVISELEKNGIRYMPMKGAVLIPLYPRAGMRQFSDCDILTDISRRGDVRAIMERLGFETVSFGSECEDVYYREPVLNFEMHVALFDPDFQNGKTAEYYADAWGRAVKDGGSGFGYRLSDEDLYIYLTAHEYKHCMISGTGLRSLLDVYVFLKRRGDGLDWIYIASETEKAGIKEFEEKNRALAEKLFGGGELSPDESKTLDYFIFSGAYGTSGNRARNAISRDGRIKYLVSGVFPPYRRMKNRYPVLGKAPVLLPFFWLLRLLRTLFTKPAKGIRYIFRAFRRTGNGGSEE